MTARLPADSMPPYLYHDDGPSLPVGEELGAGMHMDEATTRRYVDERYADLRRRGYLPADARLRARSEAIALGHTCYPSMIGPFCPVCEKDLP